MYVWSRVLGCESDIRVPVFVHIIIAWNRVCMDVDSDRVRCSDPEIWWPWICRRM